MSEGETQDSASTDENQKKEDIIHKLVDTISTCVQSQEKEVKYKDLEIVINGISDWERQFRNWDKSTLKSREKETPLHAALRKFKWNGIDDDEIEESVEGKVVKKLIEAFPWMMTQSRHNTKYSGQTPLHVAVAKQNVWFVRYLHLKLKHVDEDAKNDGKKKSYLSPGINWHSLLSRRATGPIFSGTAMLGEFPLSIAALMLDKERTMFLELIYRDAKLDEVTAKKDNIVHSLIRYSHLYPDKTNEVLSMFEFLTDPSWPNPAKMDRHKASNVRRLKKKIWMMVNDDEMKPLQLAAHLEQHEIFKFIMNSEAYCTPNTRDGLFDIKLYDITEIDAISVKKPADITGDGEDLELPEESEEISAKEPIPKKETKPYKSVLEIIIDVDPDSAYRFLSYGPVRAIINKKWRRYRWVFYPWWLCHVVFMSILTWYGIKRSQISDWSSRDGIRDYTYRIPDDSFVTIYGALGVVVGTVYILMEITRVIKDRMPFRISHLANGYSNVTFRLLFGVFSLCLITDYPAAARGRWYENYCLVVALVIGWYLFLFFVRAVSSFSFFTVLINHSLVTDILRFGAVLSIIAVSFTVSMHMALQGSYSTAPTHNHFQRALVVDIKMIVGLADIDELFEARKPLLVIFLHMLYASLTTIFLFAALIAVIGKTCNDLNADRDGVDAKEIHWRLQQLSLILFLESILPRRLVYEVGKWRKKLVFVQNIGHRRLINRQMLEMKSLRHSTRFATGHPKAFQKLIQSLLDDAVAFHKKYFVIPGRRRTWQTPKKRLKVEEVKQLRTIAINQYCCDSCGKNYADISSSSEQK